MKHCHRIDAPTDGQQNGICMAAQLKRFDMVQKLLKHKSKIGIRNAQNAFFNIRL
jgi:hypothetical protein